MVTDLSSNGLCWRENLTHRAMYVPLLTDEKNRSQSARSRGGVVIQVERFSVKLENERDDVGDLCLATCSKWQAIIILDRTDGFTL